MDDFVSKKEEKIKEAYQLVKQLEKELADYIADVNNNVFASKQDAKDELYERYWGIAAQNCGDGYCGERIYKQDFIVNGEIFTITFEVEYDRFDKRFYVVDTFRVLSIKEKVNV